MSVPLSGVTPPTSGAECRLGFFQSPADGYMVGYHVFCFRRQTKISSTARAKAKLLKTKTSGKGGTAELTPSAQNLRRPERAPESLGYAAVQGALAYSQYFRGTSFVVADLIERELDISSFELVQGRALSKLEDRAGLWLLAGKADLRNPQSGWKLVEL